MALLIDGYNLLHVTDIFGVAGPAETALHASRQALLNFLAGALDAKLRRETTIVFDAAVRRPDCPKRSCTRESRCSSLASLPMPTKCWST